MGPRPILTNPHDRAKPARQLLASSADAEIPAPSPFSRWRSFPFRREAARLTARDDRRAVQGLGKSAHARIPSGAPARTVVTRRYVGWSRHKHPAGRPHSAERPARSSRPARRRHRDRTGLEDRRRRESPISHDAAGGLWARVGFAISAHARQLGITEHEAAPLQDTADRSSSRDAHIRVEHNGGEPQPRGRIHGHAQGHHVLLQSSNALLELPNLFRFSCKCRHETIPLLVGSPSNCLPVMTIESSSHDAAPDLRLPPRCITRRVAARLHGQPHWAN